MGMFDEMKEKAADAAGQHGDKVEEHSDTGLDRGEEMIGDRAGDQHADMVGQGRDALDARIGDGGGGTEEDGRVPPATGMPPG